MSVYTTITNRLALNCDGIGCSHTFHPRGAARNREELRAAAKRQGWEVDASPLGPAGGPGVDYCPKHVSKALRLKMGGAKTGRWQTAQPNASNAPKLSAAEEQRRSMAMGFLPDNSKATREDVDRAAAQAAVPTIPGRLVLFTKWSPHIAMPQTYTFVDAGQRVTYSENRASDDSIRGCSLTVGPHEAENQYVHLAISTAATTGTPVPLTIEECRRRLFLAAVACELVRDADKE